MWSAALSHSILWPCDTFWTCFDLSDHSTVLFFYLWHVGPATLFVFWAPCRYFLSDCSSVSSFRFLHFFLSRYDDFRVPPQSILPRSDWFCLIYSASLFLLVLVVGLDRFCLQFEISSLNLSSGLKLVAGDGVRHLRPRRDALRRRNQTRPCLVPFKISIL